MPKGLPKTWQSEGGKILNGLIDDERDSAVRKGGKGGWKEKGIVPRQGGGSGREGEKRRFGTDF